MSQPKIVKRYANRKLYDTERSCYVTLDDIALMIKAGDEVRVVDNKSGEDLTSVTLAQIIFEAEKKKNFMSLSLLRDLIQDSGGQISGTVKEQVDKVKGGVQQQADKIKERARGIRTDVEGKLRGSAGDITKSLEDLQRGVEDKLKDGVGFVGREMDDLRQRLADLQARLDGSEKGADKSAD